MESGRQYASTAELISDLRNRSYYHGPELKVTMHSRFVQPFLDFTQILIGLPFILTAWIAIWFEWWHLVSLSLLLFYAITFGLRTLGAHETLLTASRRGLGARFAFCSCGLGKIGRCHVQLTRFQNWIGKIC